MSLESAKKYGFIASMINVIIPIATLVMLGMFYYQLFYQLIKDQSIPMFWTGAITGFSITVSIAGLAGLILFFVSMHKLSKYYNEPKIFKNVLYGLLITIISAIIIGIVVVVFFVLQASSFLNTSPIAEDAAAFLLSIIVGFIAIIAIGIVFAIINGVLYWQAFNKLGEKSGVDSFKTAGTLYLIGSILNVVGVGAILTWIAWIFAAEGYRKLQPQQTTSDGNTVTINYAATTIPTSAPNVSNKIYCSYCGVENDDVFGSSYCKQCGKLLHTSQTNI